MVTLEVMQCWVTMVVICPRYVVITFIIIIIITRPGCVPGKMSWQSCYSMWRLFTLLALSGELVINSFAQQKIKHTVNEYCQAQVQ